MKAESLMDHLPIFLTLKGKTTAVVGGGTAAARRVERLAAAGARVFVHADALESEFALLRDRFSLGVSLGAAVPEKCDFDGCALVFFAPQSGEADPVAIANARKAGALVNVADRPELCDFILPAILDRSPLVVAISTGGASPVLGRMLKARLETMIPASYGKLAQLAGSARTALRSRLPDASARLRFWERVLEGPAAERILAGDVAGAEEYLSREIERAASDGSAGGEVTGEVYLVGAGPGDPDLLTFRALRLMQKADVVLYDRLVDPKIIDLVRRDAERIYVGKRRDDHAMPQAEIGDLLVRLARQGKRVLRLKGGDPFIFGRGGEEIEKLAEYGVPFQVCPGVTAAAGASAYAGIPLTHRDYAQSCLFVTGHGKDGPIDLDWATILRPRQTVAIYMGLGNLQELTRQFVLHGADPALPAAIVENATRPNQIVVTGSIGNLVSKAEAANLRGPTLIIVGDVVALREKLNWCEPKEAFARKETGLAHFDAGLLIVAPDADPQEMQKRRPKIVVE
jgi:uroporphyrin-III C-methyltransferase/precorrin-2 dehydrogenase/sirohydrochlorin ferrochelatase